MDVFNQKAIEMMTSPAVREAFDLKQEKDSLRERFAMHPWGQQAILARRLAERGVPWITVVMENPYGVGGIPWLKEGVYNWDSHAVNCHIFKDARVRFPLYVQVITAMVEDLYARGLDRKVLLVVTGEFGRTPMAQGSGRDHHIKGFSFWLAGGGIKGGISYGNTDDFGYNAVQDVVNVHDFHATMLHLLGVDHEKFTFKFQGLDFRLSGVEEAHVLKKLIA